MCTHRKTVRWAFVVAVGLLLAACAPLPAGPQEIAGDLGRIAYVLDGDIWIKDLPDGQPRRITDDGLNDTPRWSATGEWLVFTKMDSQAWLYSVAAERVELFDNAAPINGSAWSPTGDRLLSLVGSGMLHLYMWDARTRESSILVPPTADGQPGLALWSPSGDRLAYLWSGMPPDETFISELRILPAAGGESVTLVERDLMHDGSITLFSWSPDGQRVLFGHGPRPIDSFIPDTTTLFSLPVAKSPAEDGAPEVVAEDVYAFDTISQFQFPTKRGIAWRGDGAAALVVGGGPPWTNKHLVLDGQALTPADQVAIHPAWSRVENSLVYSAMPGCPEQTYDPETIRACLGGRRLWKLAGGGGTTPQALTDDPDYRDEWPLWSADGQFILFGRLNNDEKASLWLLPSGGGAAQQVLARLSLPGDYDPTYGQINWPASFDWFVGD